MLCNPVAIDHRGTAQFAPALTLPATGSGLGTAEFTNLPNIFCVGTAAVAMVCEMPPNARIVRVQVFDGS
jgi:hypothetical protein